MSSYVLSAEINVSAKIKIEINAFVLEFPFVGETFCRGNSRKRKVTKFYKQIRHFSTNVTLTIKMGSKRANFKKLRL